MTPDPLVLFACVALGVTVFLWFLIDGFAPTPAREDLWRWLWRGRRR